MRMFINVIYMQKRTLQFISCMLIVLMGVGVLPVQAFSLLSENPVHPVNPCKILPTQTVTAINRHWTTINPYRYCGEQYDADLHMYFLRARYMETDRGRFWTMDSFQGRNYDPATLHKYLYTHADPVNGIDPSGEITLNELMINMFVGGIINVAATTYVRSQILHQPWEEIRKTLPAAFAVGALSAGAGALASQGLAGRLILKMHVIPLARLLASGIGGAVSGFSASLLGEVVDYYVTQKPITTSSICGSITRVFTGTVTGFASGAITYKLSMVKVVSKTTIYSTTPVNTTFTIPLERADLSGVAGVGGSGFVGGVLNSMIEEWISFVGGCH